MKIITLLKIIKEEDGQTIEFEDYNGNTLFTLANLDLADIESKGVIRLQINKKNLCK